MLKKILSVLVVGSIMIATGGRVARATEAKDKEAAFAAKVKAEIAKLGTGPEAVVEVTLRDKNKFKGYIKEANEDHFVLVRDKTGTSTDIAYPQVKKVKGNNLSTGAKVAIGVGIGIVILLVVLKDHINGY